MKLLSLILLLLLYSCNTEPDLETETGKAWDLIEELKYEEAYKKLSKILDKDPNNVRAMNYKGVAAGNMGLQKEALQYFTAAYKIDSTDYDLNLNLGVYYGSKHNFITAKTYYNKAILIDPDNSKAYSNLGVIETKTGNLNQALKLHAIAIKNDPELGGAYANRGETYLAIGNPSKALADYEKALDCKNMEKMVTVYTLNRRGLLYRTMKRYEKSIADFSESIAINNRDPYTYYYRGMSYAGINNYELAIKDFKKAKELGKEGDMNRLIEECQRLIE